MDDANETNHGDEITAEIAIVGPDSTPPGARTDAPANGAPPSADAAVVSPVAVPAVPGTIGAQPNEAGLSTEGSGGVGRPPVVAGATPEAGQSSGQHPAAADATTEASDGAGRAPVVADATTEAGQSSGQHPAAADATPGVSEGAGQLPTTAVPWTEADEIFGHPSSMADTQPGASPGPPATLHGSMPVADGDAPVPDAHIPDQPTSAVELPDFGDVDPQLGRYLSNVVAWVASDLHLTVGRPPVVRIDGKLVDHPMVPALEAHTISRMLRSVLDDERWATYLERRQVDFSVTLAGLGRFRVNAYHQLGSPAAAFRAIAASVPKPHDIGLPPDVERVANFPYGLVLFVGPTGSGKSTTQAALIGTLNAAKPCHILTIEDPVEYLHGHQVALVNQREVGTDVRSFADGLRAALREDPDVILLGEMRDEESISITLTLAETGHLVFATLHTNDAAQAMDRIIDSYASDRREQVQTQLAGALQAVVSQRLVPRIGGGRVAAFEVMMANDAVRNLVREGKTRQLRNVVATSSAEGMRTMESSLNTLVADGVVTYQEAIALTQYPKEIKDPAIAAALAAAAAAAAAGNNAANVTARR
jgi:twitching motility protein PilT